MDSRKCKICTTIFGIFSLGIILSDWDFKGILLFMWVLIWLSAAVSSLAKQKNHAAHYGISFELTIVLSAALLMAENFFIQGMICFGIFFFGLMALYRTCYPEREMIPLYTLKNINYLLFANLTLFLYPGKLPPNEKAKRTFYKIAGVTAFLCFVLFAGLGRIADINIANVMRLLWKLISENIAYIVLSIVMGLFLASALYGYLRGLSEEQLGQMAKESNTNELVLYDEKNIWIELFCNPICGIWMLNIIIFFDSILFAVNLFFYWNPFGLDFGENGSIYRSSGFVPMLIIIVLSICIFRGVNYILEYGKKRIYANETVGVLLEKCQRRLIVAVLTTFLIEIFAVARYCNILYTNGINSSNKQGLFGLLICTVILGYFLLYGFKLYKPTILKGYFCASLAAIILSALLWSSVTFPLYNMLLFTDKMERRQLTYSSADRPIGEIVITQKDIDVYFMEESGLYAITSLVKLLNYSYAYEGTDGNVADAALESIGRIFAEEFYENREEIRAAEGIEKLSLIVKYMENDPGYLLGIRRWCRQSIMKYINQHS